MAQNAGVENTVNSWGFAAAPLGNNAISAYRREAEQFAGRSR